MKMVQQSSYVCLYVPASNGADPSCKSVGARVKPWMTVQRWDVVEVVDGKKDKPLALANDRGNLPGAWCGNR